MSPHDPVKFLIVDDSEENLRALEALLQREGLELVMARSAREALELLLVHTVALALLDVQMPELDGFELAELMRGVERTRSIPIIFLTGVATDERRRFRGYEAGAVDYLMKPVDPQILRNKVDIFFEVARRGQALIRQRDELRNSAEQLAEALGRLNAHIDNSPLAIVELDANSRLLSWSHGAERMFGWTAAEMMGARLADLAWVDPEDRAALADLYARLLAGRDSRLTLECRAHRKDGSLVHCEWYVSALQDQSGSLFSVNAQILDVTERKQAEATQQLLIGELNHRVKNTLASVQAIAQQTLRYSSEPKEFAGKFSGRIQALARAHSLLSSTTWQSARLLELIRDQFHMGTLDEERVSVVGPDVCLAPQVALHVALVLHELGTNAGKYGALSAPGGTIAIECESATDLLRLWWREAGGPTVKPPSWKGFGTSLIERSLKAQGGSARVDWLESGVIWHLEVPLAATSAAPPKRRKPRARRDRKSVSRSSNRTGLEGKRLLIVEDEPLVALELTTILEDAGAEIIGPAATSEQALSLIAATSIDGALLDGNLNGYLVDDVAHALKQAKVPFVFVSGYGPEHLPEASREFGVVAKPFTRHQLIDAASGMLVTSKVQPATVE